MSVSVSRRADDLTAKKVLIEKKVSLYIFIGQSISFDPQLHVEKTTSELRHVTEKRRKLVQARY